MTVNEIRRRVAETALSYLGAHESDGSHKPIIDLYNQIRPLPRGYRMKYTDPWCAAFVSVVSFLCGLLSIFFPECGCGLMVELYKRAGRWVEDDNYLPDVGDVVFYDWEDDGKGDNTGVPDHVGVVVAISGNKITVVEGNKSDAVGKRVLTCGQRYIRGYGVPDYASMADGVEVVPDSGTAEIPVEDEPAGDEILVLDTCEVETYVLVEGASGKCVRRMQQMLIADGFDCGPDGDDGDFGPNTLAAVTRYQAAHNLEVDGIVGPKTWASLLGSD